MEKKFESNQSKYDYQREVFHRIISPQPTVIAIEGGPCSGKTTLLNELGRISENYPRPIILIPEVATEHLANLAQSGIEFVNLMNNDHPAFIEFETNILRSIIETISTAKDQYAGSDAIIVVDRVDIKPYLSHKDFELIKQSLDLSVSPVLGMADKIIYLPTVAKTSSETYEALVATNSTRYEDADQAIATCDRNLASASINPEFSVYADHDFQTRIDNALHDILNPEQETETKFKCIDDIDFSQCQNQIGNLTKQYLNRIDIYQSYHQIDEIDYRLRRGKIADQYFYHLAIKQGEGETRRELRRNLSEEEYKTLYRGPHIIERNQHKTRFRYLFEFEDRNYILALDFNQISYTFSIEIEGMNHEKAKHIKIPGFVIDGLQEPNLVQ